MKGLNVKRIAAIGIGAALVGSALAPAVMAAPAFGNLNTLQKSDIVDATGTPVVEIAVGSLGQASDVVWAGNIAAKVAQMAVVPVGGTTADKTVDVTVGGITSISGVGKTTKADLNLTSGGLEFQPIQVKNGSLPTLVDSPSYEYTWGGTTTTIAVKETVDANVDAVYQSKGNGVLAGEIVADIPQNKIAYTLDLGAGIPVGFVDDTNTDTDIQIPLLGTTYKVREVSAAGDKVVLEKSTVSDRIDEGAAVTVKGIGTYAGQDLSLVLDAVETAGVGNQTYQSTWSLKDASGNVIDQVTKVSDGADLKALFKTYINSTVYITALVSDSANKRYARVSKGLDRLELRDAREFPYNSAASSSDPQPWRVTLTASATRLTKVEIKNYDLTYKQNDASSDRLQGSGKDAYMMGPLEAGKSVDVAGLGKVKLTFEGLETRTLFPTTIGGGELKVRVDDGVRTIPLVLGPFGTGDRTVTVAGKDFTIDINSERFANWDGVLSTRADESFGSIYDSSTVYDKNVTNDTLEFHTDLTGLSTVSYKGLADNTRGDYWLVLAAQTFNLDVDGGTATAQFLGTYSNDTNSANDNATKLKAAYYLPDIDQVNTDLTTLATALELTGDYKPGSSKNQYQALVRITEPTTSDYLSVFVDTGTGDISDPHADNVTKVFDSNGQVWYKSWKLDDTTTSAADKLLMGTTEFGTEATIDGGVATVSIPDQRRQVVTFLGGNDTNSTTTGGTTITGLKAGESKTQDGVTVTVGNIAGGATTGYTIKPVGNIVGLDTDPAVMNQQRLIIVGGQMVNTLAKNLQVNGTQTLEDLLKNNGDYVEAVLAGGKIVVAGWTASDTATAAQDLISALDGLQ